MQDKQCTHTDGPQHDCRYVDARNALIPSAERFALEACRMRGIPENGPGFSRTFSLRMEALAVDAGITSGKVYRP